MRKSLLAVSAFLVAVVFVSSAQAELHYVEVQILTINQTNVSFQGVETVSLGTPPSSQVTVAPRGRTSWTSRVPFELVEVVTAGFQAPNGQRFACEQEFPNGQSAEVMINYGANTGYSCTIP